MASPGHIHGAPRQSFPAGVSMPSARLPSGTVLPPIVAPPDSMDRRDGPQPASPMGRPPLSRTSSISSDQGLPKVHHILNHAAAHEKLSAPPTPDNASNPRPFPPHPLVRAPSNERLTPTGSPCGPPPLRLPTTATLSKPTGTIDVKTSPFLPSTSQGPPMVAAGPSGPGVDPVLGPRSGYGHSHGYPAGQWRGVDIGSQSRTGSPASSHSSYGQSSTAQGSPRSDYSALLVQYPPQPMQHQQPQHPHQAGHSHQPSGPYTHTPPPYVAAQQQPQQMSPHSGSSGPYQILTLDTENGPIQVPVDVQAASKMADEKRRRNAGASARFRQRRKEKEREAAQTIARLESQLREMESDREFYRAERDYFRDVVHKHEAAKASLVPRMQSPGALSERRRQASLASSREDSGLSPSSAGGIDYRESGDRGSDDGRILRQRISGYDQDGQSQAQIQPLVSPHAAPSLHHQHQHQHQHLQAQAQYFPPMQHHPQQQQQHGQQHGQQHAQQHVQQHHGHRSAVAPPPISIQQANAHYSLPTPDSRSGTPNSASMQHPMSLPPAMRAGTYDHTGRPGGPAALETGWVARS